MTDFATPHRQQWVSSEQARVTWFDLWDIVGWWALTSLAITALMVL